MSAPSKKPKSLMLTVLISGSALAYAFFVFLPTQKSIASIRSELAQQRNDVLALGSLESEIVELERRIAAVRTTIDTWHEHAPTAQETATFIGVVSQLAQQAGVRVDRAAWLKCLRWNSTLRTSRWKAILRKSQTSCASSNSVPRRSGSPD